MTSILCDKFWLSFDSRKDFRGGMEPWTVTGTIASFLGLGLGIRVLYVATDARRAAREARSWARKKSLTEELQQAQQNIEQVGDFLHKQEWMAVRIRAQEIMTTCQECLTRWPDGLSEARRDDVLNAITLVRSIAQKAASSGADDLKPADLKRISGTQLNAAALISGALGEARNREERDGE
jgi:hypothetical protein